MDIFFYLFGMTNGCFQSKSFLYILKLLIFISYICVPNFNFYFDVSWTTSLLTSAMRPLSLLRVNVTSAA
jgi:hypothetical protein